MQSPISLLVAGLLLLGPSAQAGDYLVKLKSNVKNTEIFQTSFSGASPESLGFNNWVRVQTKGDVDLKKLAAHPDIEHIQHNYKLELFKNPTLEKLRMEALSKPWMFKRAKRSVPPDNPAIPAPVKEEVSGADPLIHSQWGMLDIGAKEAWQKTKGSSEIVVAVIDTGVDYTHPDLQANLWRNTNEIPENGIDDDNNGYVDDVIGWDFVSNDNKPYDLIVPTWKLLLGGGNPGHGTHCAGNVAARGNNNIGVSGVAPNVKIMSLRFLSEKGQGTTAGAVQAIRYAVDNGAHITSNSWGSEGEGEGNQALREAILYSQEKGRLFVAAAGNGHMGVGYDNDTDARPAYPASYDYDVIMSVAALDSSDELGTFSNWGRTAVDLGAPGVKVFSTTVDNKYSDTVLSLFGTKVTWDGTSMATPHVAGAAALYLSQNPNSTWREIKDAIITNVRRIPALKDKSVSGGKLDLSSLIN